ncbi:MAG: hypothetical protein ABW007_26690, partial [Chitinophagaceae bacterium]
YLDEEHIRQQLKPASLRRIYADLEGMISEVERVISGLHFPEVRRQVSIGKPLSLLAKEATLFAEVYEAFIKSDSPANILKLLRAGNELLLSIENNATLAHFIKERLEGEHNVVPPGYEGISLYLDSEGNYKDVLVKLTAVSELYSELCNMVGVSAAEYPLQVVKMESGSLWLKLVGESRVIGLLIKLIESSASFMYRNFTTEGNIQSIPRQVEAVEAVLRLSENLEKAGVDTAQIKDNLQTSAAVISGRLNNLLKGVKALKVNDEAFSVGNAVEERFLKESRGLLLEDGGSGENNDSET